MAKKSKDTPRAELAASAEDAALPDNQRYQAEDKDAEIQRLKQQLAEKEKEMEYLQFKYNMHVEHNTTLTEGINNLHDRLTAAGVETGLPLYKRVEKLIADHTEAGAKLARAEAALKEARDSLHDIRDLAKPYEESHANNFMFSRIVSHAEYGLKQSEGVLAGEER